MSLESEMKKLNATLERVSFALSALVPGNKAVMSDKDFDEINRQMDKPNGSFNPVTETKVVEPEVSKVSKDSESVEKEKPAKKQNRTVPADPKEEKAVEPEVKETQEADEFDADFDERPPLTTDQVKLFAREKIAENAKSDPELKLKIKKKISALGGVTISDLDQPGLVKLEAFLNKL